MKKILIISFSATGKDIRIQRHVKALCGKFEITVAGYGSYAHEGVNFLQITQSNSKAAKIIKAGAQYIGLHEWIYWHQAQVKDALSLLSSQSYDCIMANDIDTLPLALRLGELCGAKVHFDAHEYHPREFEHRFLWRVFKQRYNQYLCRKYIPQIESMTTVCSSIAAEYEKNFAILPQVLTNAATYAELKPVPVKHGKIRILHHGGAVEGRNIDLLIKVVKLLGARFTMDMYLVPSDRKYLDYLKGLASSCERIRILPPVTIEALHQTFNDYDLGFYLLEPKGFNEKCALPNKFFDFIQSRLGLLIGPSLEMGALVKKHNLGVVFDSFEVAEVVQRIESITEEEVRTYKQNSQLVAHDLSSEQNASLLLKIISQLSSQ